MSQEAVRQVFLKMLSDPGFQAAVLADPQDALAESGFILTPAEIAAIGKSKPKGINHGFKEASRMGSSGSGKAPCFKTGRY
jgi:hypothetical protein